MAKPRQPKSHDAGAELRAFVERLEKLADEKAEVAEAEKEVKAEIKARGYSVKVLQAIMKRRAMGPDKVREFDELLDLYEVRMGCAVEEAPEKRHAYLRGMADASDRKRITDNPYTANDPRRTAWERGWYEQAGMVEKVGQLTAAMSGVAPPEPDPEPDLEPGAAETASIDADPKPSRGGGSGKARAKSEGSGARKTYAAGERKRKAPSEAASPATKKALDDAAAKLAAE